MIVVKPRGEEAQFYCQPDGGQWNVRVKILHSFVALEETWYVITGPELSSQFGSVLAVPSNTVHSKEQ